MTASTGATRGAQAPADSGWVTGWTVFAGVMMLVDGVLAILQGISGIANDKLLVVSGTPLYVYRFDTVSWGWVHLVLGVLIAVTGAGVLRRAAWARWIGIFLVSLGLFAQFMFLPYYPLWALIVIAIDIFVIWALSSYRAEEAAA